MSFKKNSKTFLERQFISAITTWQKRTSTIQAARETCSISRLPENWTLSSLLNILSTRLRHNK